MQKTLKYFSFCRFSTGKQIFQVCQDSSQLEQFKQEALKVLSSLNNVKLNPDERQKINSSYGNWFCTMDEKDICYLTLTSQDYPERYAYEMMKKLKEQLEKLGDYSTEDDPSLKFASKETMQDLFKRYSDIKSFDKLEQAQSNVNEVKQVMETNINKMLKQQDNLKKVEQKSIEMSEASKKFERQSHDLERIMYWRNCKLKIIIILAILGLLCYIIIPIVWTSDAKDAATKQNPPNPDNTNSTTPQKMFLLN